jgi:hypothetical protein
MAEENNEDWTSLYSGATDSMTRAMSSYMDTWNRMFQNLTGGDFSMEQWTGDVARLWGAWMEAWTGIAGATPFGVASGMDQVPSVAFVVDQSAEACDPQRVPLRATMNGDSKPVVSALVRIDKPDKGIKDVVADIKSAVGLAGVLNPGKDASGEQVAAADAAEEALEAHLESLGVQTITPARTMAELDATRRVLSVWLTNLKELNLVPGSQFVGSVYASNGPANIPLALVYVLVV